MVERKRGQRHLFYSAYNGFGEQTGIASPDTGTTTSTSRPAWRSDSRGTKMSAGTSLCPRSSYNTGGMVLTKTDSRGKTSTYTYDVLGRMTQVSYNDTTTGTSKTYDVSSTSRLAGRSDSRGTKMSAGTSLCPRSSNGVGQLSSLTDPSGSTSFTYDSNGRVATKTSVIASMSKTLTYSSDGVGRASNIAYPSGTNVGMSYTNGRVVNVTMNSAPLNSARQCFSLDSRTR